MLTGHLVDQDLCHELNCSAVALGRLVPAGKSSLRSNLGSVHSLQPASSRVYSSSALYFQSCKMCLVIAFI